LIGGQRRTLNSQSEDFCNFRGVIRVLMAINQTAMKTNLYLSFILISGFAALTFGASMMAVFGVIIGAAILGMACNDYAPTRITYFGSAV
jgi:hypothetical protein